MDACLLRLTLAVTTALLCAMPCLGADFDDLVERVGRIENAEAPDAGLNAKLARDVSDEAIAHRKALAIRAGAGTDFRPQANNPKHQFPVVLCRLCLDPEDSEALEYVPHGMLFRGQGDTFGKSSLSRVFCQFGEQLDPAVREAVREEVTTYEGFLGGGTENHVTMRRTAGNLFGERFPEDTFHHDLTGAQLAGECRDYMRRYGKAIYAASMAEYLSPIYHAVNTAPWINVVEFAQNDEARIMARAILDWMMADYAVNNHQGIILPPVQRAKGLMTDSYQLSYARSPSQWTGWLYWGGGNTPEDEEAFRAPEVTISQPYGNFAMLHAVSQWAPHPVFRNIGAKRLQTPYMLWQSRGDWACIEPAQVNAYGKTGFAHDQEPNPRYNMRSVYVARDYAMGAGYRHEDILDPIVRHAAPFMVAWRSLDPRNWLIVSHPYWYTARKPEGSDEPIGTDDWSGVSPFCQMVHWENATVLLFDIPQRDPYEGQAGVGSPLWSSERTTELVQAAHVYVPDTIDEKAETPAGVFLREGDVYIGIRPLRPGARWEEGGHEGFERLVLDGGLVGAAIEVGDRREFGSFKGFQQKVAGTELDLSRLASEKRVTYKSTRGHTLDIRHNSEGWLPHASVNGAPLDFDRWPTCESPYVTCRDSVLDVNDGRQGFTIDWRGELPEYTYYNLAGGRKTITARERIEGGILKTER
jgi:hypothetical protein